MNSILAMLQLLEVIQGRLRPVVRAYGFTVEDLPVMALVFVNARGPDTTALSASLIAEHIGRSRQGVDQALRRLERAGLIDCWKRDNGWVGGWEPTQKGNTAWSRVVGHLFDLEELVFRTPSQRKDAVTYLGAIRRSVEDGTWLYRKLTLHRKPVRELAELRPGQTLSEESLRELLDVPAESSREQSAENPREHSLAEELQESEREELARLRREVEHYKAERLTRYLVK